ncbi:MAG: PHB depolymerase family esterase, partial [Bacteroidota bacterium]
GPPKMVEDGRAFPFILASPQVPQGQIWSAETLSALLDHLEASYRVDPERIYLTGLSMGGNGSWMLGMHEPDRFAAIVPICGWGDARRVCALKDTPVWTFHGDADQVVTIDYTDRLVTNLQRCEGNIQYTVYEGVGHDSWTPTYADEAMWDWMLSQQR